MQANNGSIIATIIIAALVILGAVFYMNSQIPEAPEVPAIPTAQDIADAVVIDIPEIDTQQQQEIWEGTYKHRIRRLKRQAEEACEDEFDIDDIEDLFGDYVEVRFKREYEDDREYDILDLGLDDEDDRHLIITGVTKWRIDDDYNDLVYGICDVTSDDGDLEADLTFSL